MNNTCRNAPSPVLTNTCRGSRASMLQCDGCLPPHTDRIQQDIRPTDRPSAAGAEDGARRKRARRRDGRRRGGPRAQPAAAGARGNYVNPNAGRDWPRPKDAHAAARSAAAPPPPNPAPTPTATGCAGSRMTCRQQTAPPPSRRSKDVTAHPNRPRARPCRPCPPSACSGRHRPGKPGSGPHYGTEFSECPEPSVEKHLSWSPGIHTTVRWVPSTPHRSHPTGHPPNRQTVCSGY